MMDSQSSMPSHSGAKSQILLVEEDGSVRASLQRVLQSENYTVAAVGSAAGARQVLRNQHVDLVLMDVDSPDQDGWTAAKEIADTAMFLPMVLITAKTGQQMRAAMTGADVLMEKPLSFPALVQTMKQLLEQTLEGRLHRLEEIYSQVAA